MKEPIIEISQLSKSYQEKMAVKDLSLTIHRGEVFGLLGPNGAGKSTTILMLLGMTEPSSGSCSVCGFDSTTKPIEVKRKVGYLPDNIGFYDDLTGLENLTYTAQLNGIGKEEAADEARSILKQVGLEESANNKVRTYSRGMKQRLGLADVLIKRPEVIILDEPTLGIDPKGVQELLELIKTLSKSVGITVLLSSHHLYQVQEICDRVGLFVDGTLVACGTIEELSNQLFEQEEVTTIVDVDDMDEQLLQAIKQVEHVITLNSDNKQIVVRSRRDVTSQLAQSIIQRGYQLTAISKRKYGLDDIYHRYFEGGKVHGGR
ncbi:ABC transporter ATP-binding protein [Bacillus salitolerans]|uniref:ABC transporter ATP-binding protein n=1 Tax=Bacillus salitolerans TaxID=1437434 RepID=A0ABW4LS18_9BACI